MSGLMAGVDITVSGDRQAAAHLVAIGARAERQQPVMAQAARETARETKVTAVDTGRLAKSVEVLAVGDEGFTVGTRVPYARYVFEGTRYVDAQPPRIPTDVGSRTARAMAADIVR